MVEVVRVAEVVGVVRDGSGEAGVDGP